MLAVISAQRDAILPLVVAGAGAALVPEAMALIAEKLGAVVVRPSPPAVRDLVLVHRLGTVVPRRRPDSWNSQYLRPSAIRSPGQHPRDGGHRQERR